MYYVLYGHEDGLHAKEFTKQQLLEAMSGEDYGFDRINWHSDLKDFYSLLNHCHQGVIIKGDVVTPFTKQVVTKYDIK